jgi:hypothetical protein
MGLEIKFLKITSVHVIQRPDLCSKLSQVREDMPSFLSCVQFRNSVITDVILFSLYLSISLSLSIYIYIERERVYKAKAVPLYAIKALGGEDA